MIKIITKNKLNIVILVNNWYIFIFTFVEVHPCRFHLNKFKLFVKFILFLFIVLIIFISVQYIKMNFIKLYQDNLALVSLVTICFIIIYSQFIISHLITMNSKYWNIPLLLTNIPNPFFVIGILWYLYNIFWKRLFRTKKKVTCKLWKYIIMICALSIVKETNHPCKSSVLRVYNHIIIVTNKCCLCHIREQNHWGYKVVNIIWFIFAFICLQK